jgi:ABC-type transporter Mla MlaB component
MLKITLHDTASEFHLRLEGKLAGLWVRELGQCWQTAASTTAGRKTVVDLREVDFVDEEGEALLCRMRRAGVKFLSATPLIRDIVTRCATVEDKVAPRDHVSACPEKHGSDPRPL